MKQRRVCDSLLALLGIVAVAVYVLACRPSFSPDGSKIVFTSFDPDGKQTSVLCYDLKAKTLEKVYQTTVVDKVREPDPAAKPDQKKEAEQKPFSFSFDSSQEQNLASAQWLSDGKRVAINALSYVLILHAGSTGPVRLLQLQNALDSGTLMRPLPVLGKYQFIPDKEFLLRVNLETGEMLAAPDKKGYMLFGQGNQLYYLVAADVVEKPGSSEATAESVEIGRLNPDTLGTSPLLKLKGEEQYGELTAFGAAARDGGRLALTTSFSKIPKVLLFRDNKLEKTLALAKEGSGIEAGNVEWSADGKALYVAYARKQEDAPCRYGVLEVPVDGGSMREIPLFTGDSRDSWTISFQIAIAPDGRTLAGSSTCFENNDDIKSEDRALYLVDLGSAARKVTKVPVPLERTGKPAAPK
jgi:hypothetical protein